MVLEDGTSETSMASMFLDSWYSERNVLNPIQFIEEEMDDVSEVETPVQSVFLPNYKEFPEEAESLTDSTMEASEMEDLFGDNIFKVWELDMPDEEDEFGKHLNKAILSEETSFFILPESLNDDSELLDSVAVGIADLSLDLD